jgi:hypothetical protein
MRVTNRQPEGRSTQADCRWNGTSRQRPCRPPERRGRPPPLRPVVTAHPAGHGVGVQGLFDGQVVRGQDDKEPGESWRRPKSRQASSGGRASRASRAASGRGVDRARPMQRCALLGSACDVRLYLYSVVSRTQVLTEWTRPGLTSVRHPCSGILRVRLTFERLY